MRFFNRRPAAIDPNTVSATGAPVAVDKGHHRHHGTYGHASGSSLNARPTFGEWFRGTLLDLITMFILGAIGLGVRLLNIKYNFSRARTDTIHFRSTLLIPHRRAHSLFFSEMEKSSTLNSPTHCARKSYPFGQQQCWVSLCPFSSSASCKSAFVASGISIML